jgi:hypothetical protein
MGQNWNVSGCRQGEKEVLEPRRRHVMRRLDQHIPRVAERQQTACAETGYEIGDHVIVGTRSEAQCDARVVERMLQLRHGLADLRAGIVIKAGQNVRGAGDDKDAVSDGRSRHGQ